MVVDVVNGANDFKELVESRIAGSVQVGVLGEQSADKRTFKNAVRKGRRLSSGVVGLHAISYVLCKTAPEGENCGAVQKVFLLIIEVIVSVLCVIYFSLVTVLIQIIKEDDQQITNVMLQAVVCIN